MPRKLTFLFLVLTVSLCWAQSFTVLNENPIDISQGFNKDLKIGIRNEGEAPLTLSLQFSAVPNAAPTTYVLEPKPSERYVSIAVPETVMHTADPGLLRVIAGNIDSPNFVVERELEKVQFPFHPALIGVPVLIWLPILAFIFIFAAWWRAEPENVSLGQGWIPGEPELDFKKSFGSLSTLVLAASNTGILSALTGVSDSSSKGLQIMAVIFTIPLIIAPLLVKLGARQCPGNDKRQMTPVWLNLLGYSLVLIALLAQAYILHLWLTETGGIFVAARINFVVPIILGIVALLNSFSTVARKVSNSFQPQPGGLTADQLQLMPRINTLY